MQPDAKLYERLGIEPPVSVSHGVTLDNLREKLEPANARNWRLVGNELYCDTDHGAFMQRIDPSYILKGTDESGLPILAKVV